MTDIKLFSVREGLATEMASAALTVENELHTLLEINPEIVLGIRFTASKFSTGTFAAAGLITLSLDEKRLYPSPTLSVRIF